MPPPPSCSARTMLIFRARHPAGWRTPNATPTKSIGDLALTRDLFVIEVACNDGYLLKNFVAAGIPCLGIEPTESTAKVAEGLGIPVLREFFGEALGRRLRRRSAGRSHRGQQCLCARARYQRFHARIEGGAQARWHYHAGIPSFVMRLIEQAQFDTVYHEHFSYLSLYCGCAHFRGRRPARV